MPYRIGNTLVRVVISSVIDLLMALCNIDVTVDNSSPLAYVQSIGYDFSRDT